MDPYEFQNRKILSPLDKKKIEDTTDETTHTETLDNIQEKDEKQENVVSKETVVAHLTDLRKQLIRSACVFIFFLIAVFSTINLWFPFITKGNELIILGPLEVVKFYMSISVTLSLGLSLPFICHYLWQFVKPGLNDNESKFIGFFSPLMLLLFICGIAFGYYVVNPMSYHFLVSLGEVNFNVMVSANEYIHFLIMTTVPLGLLFELPIVALFLSTIGILTAESMKKVRRWSYVILAVVSAVITPPDFISQLLVLIPMLVLYEVSIFVVRRAEVRKAVMAHQ